MMQYHVACTEEHFVWKFFSVEICMSIYNCKHIFLSHQGNKGSDK